MDGPQFAANKHDDDGRGAGRRQQVQPKQTNRGQRQRVVGLMPTDGQDAYKRTSTGASKRSRADRLSYLVATGHINKEEVQELFLPLDETNSIGDNENSNSNSNNNPYNSQQIYNRQLPANNTTSMTTPLVIRTNPATPQPSVAGGDQALLDYASSASITPDSFRTNSQKIKENLKVRLPTDNRCQFERTRTEVTLPMRTSPAFEYILKGQRRRNRRCYLWLLYSALMTIGSIVIVFCGIQLAARYQNHQ